MTDNKITQDVEQIRMKMMEQIRKEMVPKTFGSPPYSMFPMRAAQPAPAPANEDLIYRRFYSEQASLGETMALEIMKTLLSNPNMVPPGGALDSTFYTALAESAAEAAYALVAATFKRGER